MAKPQVKLIIIWEKKKRKKSRPPVTFLDEILEFQLGKRKYYMLIERNDRFLSKEKRQAGIRHSVCNTGGKTVGKCLKMTE